MNTPEAVPLDLGIQVADGEKLKLAFDGRDILASFQDWREIETCFRCSEVISFRWQPIEYFHAGERPDSTYEIMHSAWVQQHEDQSMIGSAQVARHFKLNFNAIGCLEIICSKIRAEPTKSLQTTPGLRHVVPD